MIAKLTERIEECYKENIEDSVKCGLFVLADAVDGNKDAFINLVDAVDKNGEAIKRNTEILTNHSGNLNNLNITTKKILNLVQIIKDNNIKG